MIVREHYAESYPGGADGNLAILDYTATAIPEPGTLTALLLSYATLFTVTTASGTVLTGLRKDSIVLEGAAGGTGRITARIRYLQRAEDIGAASVAVAPAGPAGSLLPAVAPGTIGLPLLSHHWTIRVGDPFTAPVTELRCTGTCRDTSADRAVLQAGLGGNPGAVLTPQFGILGAMVKETVAFEPQGSGMLKVTLAWRGIAQTDPALFPLVEIRQTSGLTPGSCTVTKTQRGAPPTLGQGLGDILNFEGRFIGRIVNADRYASASGLHSASLTAFDPRWEMAGAIIGSAPTGTDTGAAINYALRGYEWIFNRHGLPDQDPGGGRFREGDGAAYWNYGAILGALAAAYMPASVIGLPAWSALDNADKTPGEIDLRGRDLASAVDALLAQLGYTWTVRYDGTGAVLHPFREADGTVTVPVSSVAANARAATTAKRAETIQDGYGETEVLSAPALCQCGFASGGGGGWFTGLLPFQERTLDDAEFAYEYRPDFSGINALFPFVANRSAAERGYPLHHELAARLLDGSTGYAPARLSGDPAPGSGGIPATTYFWVTWDALDGAWRRVVGGIELRFHPGAVRVRRRIAVHSVDATQQLPKVEQLRPLDHAGFKIAGTLAFVSDYRVGAVAGSDAAALGLRRRVVTQRDVAPAFACGWIGDAFDADDLNNYQAFPGLATLVSADLQLAQIAAAAQAGQTADRVQGEARLAYWPDAAAVGQALSLDGALLGGDCGVITEAVYRRDGTESCTLRASNQPVSNAQGRMRPVEAARRHFLGQLASS